MCHLFNGRTSKYQINDNGRFPCHRCEKSYKQKTHLIRHINFECGVEPKFTCICGKKFKQRSNFNKHVKMLRHC